MRYAVLLCLLGLAGSLTASEKVLDLDRGGFRAFLGWRTPTVATASGSRVPTDGPLRESSEPADGWTAPGFDDSAWCRVRGPVAVAGGGAGWKFVCVRAAFEVTDPAQVRDLRLEAGCHGGARVFVNGAEVARAHLPQGEIRAETLANRYPDEAFLRPDGRLYGGRDEQDKELAGRMKVRLRTLGGQDGVAIPAALLRKGVNVLAIESRTAPLNEAVAKAPAADRTAERAVGPHAGVVTARLVCASTNGLVPGVGPASGIRIGNVTAAETLTVWDYVLPAERLQPVRIAGARNGTFSGRVLLSSAEAIRGLKATATDLVQPAGAGRIPAAAVRVRWAEAATPAASWCPEGRFDRLLAEPPTELAPAKVGRSGVLSAAVVPVWITVRVPADAAPGTYKGTVTVEARGVEAATFTVPLELVVSAWRVPDPAEFATINNLLQSPDSVAQYYKVPLWSDRHFELMGKSLDALHQVGNRLCTLNLISRMHGFGNSESMVRWVRKADGSYDHDFSAADRYMDLYAKTCGQPLIVQVYAWAFPGDNPARPKWPQASVTVVDSDGKRLDDMLQPSYGTPENEAFWRPVLTELRARLEKRGWWDATGIGWLTYQTGPGREIVDVARKIWPDGRWIKNSHQAEKSFLGMPVACNSSVWGVGAPYDPDCELRWGKSPLYFADGRLAYPRPWASDANDIRLGIPRWGAGFVRPGLYAQSPLMRFRAVSEAALQGNIRGVGQVGGDFWPLAIGSRGRMETICTGEGAVTPRVSSLALCSPGPDGAIFNERLEMFREGVQLAEAIVYLQKVVAAKRVPADLAGRIERLLDERARQQIRNKNPLPVGPSLDPGGWLTREGTDWQAQDAELLALAGEVAGRSGEVGL